MTLDTALKSFRPTQNLVFPKLDYLIKATNRIFDRWPDIIPKIEERKEEAVIASFLEILENDDWEDVKLGFVQRAVRVAFSEHFRTRPDVKRILEFVYAELVVSTNRSFVNALAAIYVSTYEPEGKHSVALGKLLKTKRHLLNNQWQSLETEYPQFFDGRTAHEQIGRSMLEMVDPWAQLKRIGIRDPHSTGLMDYAQDVYVEKLGPRLKSLDGVNQLFRWLNPVAGKKRTTGSTAVIKAVLSPWLNTQPDESFREEIAELLVSQYNDPRTQRRHWLGVDELHMNVIFSWLTKEDLRFFISVVDATQDHPQWPPRKALWLKLYDEGLIQMAWVAFCPRAERYAREHLLKLDGQNSGRKFARQTRGSARRDTSILIMKIHDKIVVDGCHNYRTHFFNDNDPNAPRLFELAYDCDEIMHKAPHSQAHNQINYWARWVRSSIKSIIPQSHGLR